MELLFVHEAFPAQFGHVALELSRRYGWKCRFLVEDLSRCPTPTRAMLETLEIQRLPVSAEFRENRALPWPQMYSRYLELCQATFAAVRARPDLRPDLVVAHGGCGAPTLFLREILQCPIINYCEYYFALGRCDISYRIDLPPAEPAQFYPRCINAIVLPSLIDCDSGYSPTAWQRQSFPKRFWPKIEVHFDGVDTELYRPRSVPRMIAGNAVPADTRIITYIARGLESMRGFDQFMKVSQRIYRERSNVLFVVVGSELTYYGWDKLHIEGQGTRGQGSERGLTPNPSPLTPSFKQWVLSQGDYDLSRFVFIDHLLPEQLAEVLCLSDLHIYLTVPFVLSWSMLDALASGCLVLASDVPPVREVIEPEVNGLVAPFFDTDQLADRALGVLRDPAAHQPLRDAARARMEEHYSIEACIPRLKAYFERVAGALAKP